jgi:hypothetical protein
MAITAGCGPHCGIRASAENTVTREGHCPCCHPGAVPPSLIDGRLPAGPAGLGRPMCWAWYEGTGGRKPWEGPA